MVCVKPGVRPRDPNFGSGPCRKRPGWSAVAAARRGSVREIDGDLVHRLGPRVVDAALELATAIHADAEALRSLSPAGIPEVGSCVDS